MPGPAVLISFVIAGARLPVRRPLLRRIRLDDSGIRQRLHLRLRHDGPLHGLVHRLEHGAGISASRRRPWRWAGRAISSTCCTHLGIAFPAAFANAPIAGTGFHDLHLTGAIINLPAVLLIAVAHGCFWSSACSESARFNALMVMIKIGDRAAGDRVRPALRACRPTFIPSFRPTPARSGKFGVTRHLRAPPA